MVILFAMTTMRQARAQYFIDNDFGEDGGYNDRWVIFKMGPLRFPIPNTAARKRAVPYHDLHHIITGYPTDWVGEFEISAWEVAGGCRDQSAAWLINLNGLAGGALLRPRRIFAAFVRGRHTRNLYDQDLDAIMDLSVAQARALTATDHPPSPATREDRRAFLRWTATALAVSVAPYAVLLGIGWAGLRLMAG